MRVSSGRRKAWLDLLKSLRECLCRIRVDRSAKVGRILICDRVQCKTLIEQTKIVKQTSRMHSLSIVYRCLTTVNKKANRVENQFGIKAGILIVEIGVKVIHNLCG